jgi:hypothetical protein
MRDDQSKLHGPFLSIITLPTEYRHPQAKIIAWSCPILFLIATTRPALPHMESVHNR